MSHATAPVSETKRTTSVARVPWHVAVGVGFVLAVYYVSQLLAGAIVGVYGLALHKTGDQLNDWVTNSVGVQFLFLLLVSVMSIAAVRQFLAFYGVNFATIGLGRPRLKDVGSALLCVPAYYVLFVGVVKLISHFVPGLNVDQAQEIGFTNVHGLLALSLTFVSLVVLPPITEEILVRGVLYSSFRRTVSVVWAVILTSGIFAAGHLHEGGSSGPLYIAAIDTFVLSLVLIYLRERTGSLWACITLHAIKNSVAFVALFVLKVN